MENELKVDYKQTKFQMVTFCLYLTIMIFPQCTKGNRGAKKMSFFLAKHLLKEEFNQQLIDSLINWPLALHIRSHQRVVW